MKQFVDKRQIMKPPRKTHNTSDSCSCTSCLYRSESDRPSLQRLILKQSKIDRLYYGKYVPLREKKLLDKLVRTRAVYDDIRAQLVSDSASSIQKNADFNAKTSSNELQKSSAILEIVNLVDKGAALKTPNLSECCSCCSCSSKTHLHQNKQSRKLHNRKHARDHYEREGLRYNMKKRKGVRFLPKHIKSDPCTCTFEYLGISNNANLDSNIESSLNIDEEIQPRPRKPPLNIVDSKTKIKNIITDSLQKIKDSTTMLQDSLAIRAKESLERLKNIKNQLNSIKKLPEEDFYILENRKVTILKNAGRSSYEKIKASQTRLKNKIIEKGEIVDVRRRNSINKLKQIKNNINTNVKRSLDKLIIKKKPKKKLNVLSPEQHTQLAHKIRKDSIAKFKEDLRRKKQLQDWICEEPCIQGTCDPKQCLKKLKLKRNVKERRRGRRDKSITHISKSKRRDENNAISSNSSNVRIQTRSRKKASKLQQKTPKDNTKKLQIKPALSIKKLRNKEKLTITQEQRKETKLLKKQLKVKSSSERESIPRQVVRIGSSFSFNVEFFKENPRSDIQRSSLNDRKNNNQASGLTLNSSRKQKSMLKRDKKSSQASLKLLKHKLAKKLKHIQKHRQTALQKSESVQCDCLNESLAERQNNQNSLLPFQCEPSICIPGICDPGNCLKLIQKRLATRSKQSYTSSRKTKSTSSVTTKSKSSKAKQVQSAIIPRRKDVMEKEKLKFRQRKVNRKPMLGNIVRIGSTFSFNIEFQKESKIPHQKGIENWQELNTFSIKPKTKQLVRDNKPEYLRRDVYRKEKNFKRRTSTTGTETDYSGNFKTRNTSTGTKNNNIQYLSQLLPYECTPGTCIPGECNPYECLEKIKKRHNTREVSLGTLSPENKSTYSDTKNKSKAAFVQFKPSTKGRKILVKSKIGDSKLRKPNFGSMALNSNAKQVVNIGSTFSFNVEFSKSYSKKDIEKDLNPSSKVVNFSTRKKVKERGVEIEKKVGHVETQMEKVRKAEKSSLVGPILKRCFCTLNLYKKQKNDLNNRKKLLHANTTYTVNTALLPEQQYSSIYLKKMQDYYDDVSGKQSKLRLLPCQKYSTKQSLEITSNLSVDVKLIKKSLKYSKKNLQQISTTPSSSKIKKIESYTVYGLSKYLKRCFCTMNMQNINTFRKLKPYECEPGVCIPGECDPYECQKLIMKRLVKGYSKVSSTDSKPISISSSQTQKNPSQSHFTNAEFKSQHKTKEQYRQSPPNVTKVKGAKQSVRIGSSFSFDVEFNKNRPRREKPKTKVNISTSRSAAKSNGTPRKKSGKYKNKTIYTKHDNRESVSQVNTETKHNETNAQDDISRCFCTLKLHKKSKVKTSIGHNQTMPYQQTGIFTESRGQNTKGFIRDQHLLPYECEPGICIPGECNPYECLARINRRNFKETGMATITASTAASSNTIRPKKKLKSRAVKVKEIKSKIQPIRRVTPAGHRKSNKTSVNTNRQAVKIGSTFSFNIDFYKDATNALNTNKLDKVRTKRSKQRPIQTKSKDTKHKGKKISTAYLKSQTKVLQTVQSPHKNMATMVKPFLKRCFCTLQLRNQRNVGTESNKLKKKVYRSVMTMTDKRKLDPNECEPGVCIPYNCDPYECEKLIKKRLNQEMNVNMIANPNLLPYECEPNFCIPGKCDPYVCLERIKNRNLKSTEIADDKKSIGHTESTSVQNEQTKLQFRHPSIKKTLKSKQTLENTKTQRKSKFSKEVKRSNLSHRTLSDTEIHMKPIQKSQKILKQKHIQEGKRRSSNQSNTLANSKSIKSEIISNLQRCFCTLSLRKNNTDNDKSQIVKEKEIQTRNQWPTKESVTKYIEPSKSTASAVGTFIKKCFCTLKLNTRKVPKSPQVKLRINPHKPRNQLYKLEPYECEPNTCIPGDCDPYECEKRIKKRLLRENAADPMKLKYTSKSTLTPTSRTKNISRAILVPMVKTNNGHTHRVPGIKSKSSSAKKVAKKLKRASDNKRQNKQSVRIGSSFSFDIEFFKDKSGAKGDTPYHKKTKDVINRATKENKMQKKTGHTKRTPKIGKAQGTTSRVGKYNASQLTYSPTKSSSTLTDPMLKRCFCTLQLQNAAGENNNQNIPRQREQLQTQNKTTHTNVSYNVSSPYECPPFMCIPNQCDPYDCARKLEKLNVRNQGIGTKERRRMHQSVEVKHYPKQKKSQKTQSYINKKPPTHDHEQGIVEIPRFTNYLKKENRQGVKFGSNMSFNIEFYKEFTSPTPVEIRKLKSKENKIYTRSKQLINKHVDSNVIRKRFTDKIVPSIRSDARNTESQVYKSSVDSKGSNTTNKLKRCFCTLKLQKHKTASNVPYPQSFEVRRAVVKKYKENPLKETFSQVKCVNIQGVCKNVKINSPDTNPKNNEMQTILSYKPKKFNKKCSETLLLENNIKTQSSKKRMTWTSKKRLTKKQSAHPINVSTKPYISNISTTQMHQSKYKGPKTTKRLKHRQRHGPSDDIRSSYSDRRTKVLQSIPKIRTSKSLMLSKRSNTKKSKYINDNIHHLVGNQFEAGDAKGKHLKFGCKCLLKNNKDRISTNINSTKHKSKESTNKVKSVKLSEIPKEKMVVQKDGPCPYCGQCVKGGIGNICLTKINSCMHKIKQWSSKQKDNAIAALIGTKEIKSKELKPLFNVYLEADGLSIINKEEVTEKVTRLQTKTGQKEKPHDKFCTCCLCLGKKGKNKRDKDNIKTEPKKSRRNKRKDEPICVCGSKVCAKDVKRQKKSPAKKKEKMPCFCGSPICAEETAMMEAMAQGPASCICQEEYEKSKQRDKDEYFNVHRLLSAKFRREDSERRKRRRKADQRMKKSIEGNKNDVLLVAGSVFDVAKLGFSGVSDMFRIVYRCARDPKHTWHSMKAMAKDPSLIGKTFRDTFSDSNVAATSRRIGMRISNMGSIQRTKELLEQNAMTNYILHMADKNPKKHLRKRKRKPRTRDQVDSNCNLYLSSLRKRPFMWIFKMCPSFYPHCLSFLNVWKQFAEVMAFLLAVVVWSPCIFAMEVCRAVICCTLCTG
ncbi:uncharacterized protein LOC123690018 [Pieris rapae]|uniref:uncharacterized protein LOC123690018 n=1 Tax=Pieris rapae TaxID=64459 RepID=UPI001E27A54C|nr:uncharacterized protein LOC123690018 [Pieris rapae]